MDSKPVLHYFKLYGRGEPIRFALQFFGIEYEEKELAGKLTDGEEGGKAWAEARKTYEFGMVPVLEIDGKKLSQTKSILRYIFQRQGNYPTDKYDIYRLESLVDLYSDIEGALMKAYFSPDQAATMKEFMTTTFQERMTQLSKRLKENESQEYLVGNKLSVADVLYCNFRFTTLNQKDADKKAMIDGAFAAFEDVNKYFEARRGDFAKRLDSRPDRPL